MRRMGEEEGGVSRRGSVERICDDQVDTGGSRLATEQCHGGEIISPMGCVVLKLVLEPKGSSIDDWNA